MIWRAMFVMLLRCSERTFARHFDSFRGGNQVASSVLLEFDACLTGVVGISNNNTSQQPSIIQQTTHTFSLTNIIILSIGNRLVVVIYKRYSQSSALGSKIKSKLLDLVFLNTHQNKKLKLKAASYSII